MQIAALVLAALAALVHVYIWTLESLTWRQPSTWKRFSVTDQAQADTTAGMAYNQGFYNLFLALGTTIGIVLVATDHDGAGWAMVLFGCGSMVAAALVLVTSGRHYARAAATQGLFPLVAVVLGAIAAAG